MPDEDQQDAVETAAPPSAGAPGDSDNPIPLPGTPAAEAQPEQPDALDGVFVVVQYDESRKDIVAVSPVPNGEVRKSEIGDILRTALAVHERQFKG